MLHNTWRQFHKISVKWFSLTTVKSYRNPCNWLAVSKFVSKKLLTRHSMICSQDHQNLSFMAQMWRLFEEMWSQHLLWTYILALITGANITQSFVLLTLPVPAAAPPQLTIFWSCLLTHQPKGIPAKAEREEADVATETMYLETIVPGQLQS